MQQTGRDRSYFVDGSQERSFVGLRRFVKAADLSHELQRSGSNLLGVDRRIEVEQGFDISAHCSIISRRDVPVVVQARLQRSAFPEVSAIAGSGLRRVSKKS